MIEKELRISVAMATYNGEAFIEQQIESILRQTRTPDELVISDDCSTDRTLQFIRSASTGCSFPVRILRNARNVGPTRNFENAIREATGDIIFPSDQDDYWLPDRVDVTVSIFSENPDFILAYCDAELTDCTLHPSGMTLFDLRPGLRTVPQKMGAKALAGAALVQGMTIAFHRNLKPFVLPFSDHCTWDRWLSIIARAVGDIRAIDRPLVFYRRHTKNCAGPLESEEELKQRWIRAADVEVYTYRTQRWDAIHRRLREVKASGLSIQSANNLDEFIEASERCLSFARSREIMKKKPRIDRLWSALLSLTRGDYHRYATGIKSCILDLVAR